MRVWISALMTFGVVGCFKTPQTSIPGSGTGGAGLGGAIAGSGGGGGSGVTDGGGTGGISGMGGEAGAGGSATVGSAGRGGGSGGSAATSGMGGGGAGVGGAAGRGGTSGGAGGAGGSCAPPNTQCPTACANLATDTNNCTACGMVCLPPPANGHAICQGTAGCGVQCDSGHLKCANTCCDTPPANAFATCSIGACGVQCNSGNHACNGTPSPCYDDTDVAHCGPSCLDCRQPNATAVCSGTQCANICNGTMLSCPGVGGKANCGSWSFESGTTEGWSLDRSQSSQDASDGTISAGTARAFTGVHALAMGFTGDGVSKYDLRVTVTLCSNGAALNLSGKTFHANLFLDRRTGSSLSSTGQTGTVQSGPVDNLQFHDFSFDDGGQWIAIGVPVTGPATTSFEIILPITVPWSGTVYLDDVQIL